MSTNPPSLLDLAPQPFETIDIARGKIAIFPVSMSQIATILRKHPEISEAFSGKASISIKELAVQFPEVALEVAYAATKADPDEGAAVIDSLDVGDIVDIVLTAVELSMPGGLAGFLDRFSDRIPKVETPKEASAKPLAQGEKLLTRSKPGSAVSSTRSQKRATASRR